MNFKTSILNTACAPKLPNPEDEGGGGSGDGGNADAWRTALAGDNTERLEALKGYESPDKLFERLGRPPIDDWRQAMAGEDAEDLKMLEAVSDPAVLFKRFKDTKRALSESGRVRVPGADATDEDKAAWRTAIGVAEKADAYEIKAAPPKGYEASDSDKEILGRLQTKLHDALANGAKAGDVMNLAHEFYWTEAAAAGQAAEDRAAELALETEAELQKAWGSKYDDNVKLAVAAVKYFYPGNPSEDDIDGFLGMTLPTGHKLGDHPVFLRMFAQAALESSMMEDPVVSAMRQGGKGVDPEARKRELLELRTTDPKAYEKAAAPGGELDRINAALQRQKDRAA